MLHIYTDCRWLEKATDYILSLFDEEEFEGSTRQAGWLGVDSLQPGCNKKLSCATQEWKDGEVSNQNTHITINFRRLVYALLLKYS